MNPNRLICTGGAGSVVAAICCFTPLLVIALGAVGLSAWLGWIDYVLFPVLFGFMGLTAYALYLRAGRVGPAPKNIIVMVAIALSVLVIWLEFRLALPISLAAAAVVAGYGLYLRRLSAQSASTAT